MMLINSVSKCLFQKRHFFSLFFLIVIVFQSQAHNAPNTNIGLSVRSKHIEAEIHLPVSELNLALGKNLNVLSDAEINALQPELRNYLLKHCKVYSEKGELWAIKIDSLKPLIQTVENDLSSPNEINAFLTLTPPKNASVRQFVFAYDAIVHQVANHVVFVALKNDWEGGQIDTATELATIKMDFNDNKVYPLKINLKKGNVFQGFWAMILLGMKHIREGIDHLLFLVVLVLPALMVVKNGKWQPSDDSLASLKKITQLTIAFTIGHSLTLIIGVIGWFNAPVKPVEMLIAISIIITAIHAIKPIFPNKEVFIAAFFGLIHGCAFATILSDLHLPSSKLLISLLGFNLGIEIMQLLVILLIIPLIYILNKTKYATQLRIMGAIILIIIATAWLMERYTEQPNFITSSIEKLV